MCVTSQGRKTLAIAIVIFSVFIHAGCIRNSPRQPMTSDSLDLLSRARVVSAVIVQSRPRNRVNITNDPDDSQRKIIQCLLPVVNSKSADMSELIDSDYVFYFQSGRNPITFEIQVCGSQLCYRANGFDHVGGNAPEFKKVVASLFNAN